jgi:hypothetical protein
MFRLAAFRLNTQQLKQVPANTELTREKVCAGALPFRPGDRDLFPSPSNRELLPLGDWGLPGDLHRD